MFLSILWPCLTRTHTHTHTHTHVHTHTQTQTHTHTHLACVPPFMMHLYEIYSDIFAFFVICGIFQFVNQVFITEYLFMHLFVTFVGIAYGQRSNDLSSKLCSLKYPIRQ